MPRVWLRTKPGGFSVVEALLAATIFGMLTTAVVGAIIYGRNATASSGDRTRANFLAEEGIEALRGLRDSAFTNLTDGTYGLVQSGGTWTLSGSSDTTGIFTRQITIASNGTTRKNITSTVSWPQGTSTLQTSLSTQLTNWLAALPKSWRNATLFSSNNLTGTIAGYKIATQGNYAYLIRTSATGPNFFIIDISTTSTPNVVGSLTISGTPTNVGVSGNYAYVTNTSDTQELQVISIATPTAPSQVGGYNAAGNANGLAVTAIGSTVYLARATNSASDEFVILNASTPSAPTRVGGYSLNINMNDVYVNGTVAYLATSSDTQEVLVLNIATPSAPTLGTAINLPGTTDATTLDGTGSTLVIGQGTVLYTASMAAPLAPTQVGFVTLPSTILKVSADATHNYAHAGTNFATGEFQVVDFGSAATPSILSSVDLAGSLTLSGVAYNSGKDVTVGASSNTNLEFVLFAPN